jgi:hypothetical protein
LKSADITLSAPDRQLPCICSRAETPGRRLAHLVPDQFEAMNILADVVIAKPSFFCELL